ncbi:MAG: DUF1214 domain-containing protein, partial [Planctomycetes bacterium]|nr:DUF1214 domain-containing protein [Planctomycetota bacterium]
MAFPRPPRRAGPLHVAFNEDGSLDILIQHKLLAREWRSNWLPAPAGRFDMVLRLYWPGRDV